METYVALLSTYRKRFSAMLLLLTNKCFRDVILDYYHISLFPYMFTYIINLFLDKGPPKQMLLSIASQKKESTVPLDPSLTYLVILESEMTETRRYKQRSENKAVVSGRLPRKRQPLRVPLLKVLLGEKCCRVLLLYRVYSIFIRKNKF